MIQNIIKLTFNNQQIDCNFIDTIIVQKGTEFNLIHSNNQSQSLLIINQTNNNVVFKTIENDIIINANTVVILTLNQNTIDTTVFASDVNNNLVNLSNINIGTSSPDNVSIVIGKSNKNTQNNTCISLGDICNAAINNTSQKTITAGRLTTLVGNFFGDYSILLGSELIKDTNTIGINTIAVGHNNSTVFGKGENVISIGVNQKFVGNDGISLGKFSGCDGKNSISIGAEAISKSDRVFVIGHDMNIQSSNTRVMFISCDADPYAQTNNIGGFCASLLAQYTTIPSSFKKVFWDTDSGHIAYNV